MKKLSKLKMPKKADEKDMDLESMMAAEDTEGPGEEDMESPEYQAREDELGIEKHDGEEEAGHEEGKSAEGELEMVSDDDLLAEVKKRGLMKDLEESEHPAEEASEESMY